MWIKTKYKIFIRGPNTSLMLASLLEENLRIQYSLFKTKQNSRVKTDLHLPLRMKAYIQLDLRKILEGRFKDPRFSFKLKFAFPFRIFRRCTTPSQQDMKRENLNSAVKQKDSTEHAYTNRSYVELSDCRSGPEIENHETSADV